MLTVKEIACIKGSQIVFEQLSFQLRAGNALILRGGNGSGKTSLLRILAGLDAPAQGQIQGQKSVDMLFITHNNALKQELTISDHLQFWGALYNAKMRVERAIKIYGLNEQGLDRPVHELSAGWQRRVSLARLALSSAPLWLLDEPFSHIDADMQNTLITLIKEHTAHKGAVIFSHHGELPAKLGKTLNLEDFAPYVSCAA